MTTINPMTSSSYVSTGLTDLDTEALIEEAYNADMAVADTVQVEIDELELEVAAFKDLQDLLEALENAAEALTAKPELDRLRDDVWVEKSAYLSSSDANTDASDVVGVQVDNEAASGKYTLEVKQLATNHKLGGKTYNSATESLGLNGSINVAAGANYDGVDIEVTEDMTLKDIANAINEESDLSGVTANVLKISDDEYILVLSAIDTGQEIQFDMGGADISIAQALGLLNANGQYSNELVSADQAVFSIDGVEFTRSSNTIDDVIDGVTLYLYAEEEGSEVTLEIEEDGNSAYEAIKSFVDAYNKLRSFVLTNQAYEAGEGASEDAVLFGDSLLSSIMSTVYNTLSFNGSSDTYATLASMGIAFDDSNYLVIDEEVLEDAIISDFDAVADLFSFSGEADSDSLLVSEADGNYTGTFTVDIEVDANGNVSSASVDGNDSIFKIDGNKLVGAEGTEYEGLTLFFGGGNSESVEVSISSGLAYELNSTLDRYTNSADGLISSRQDRLSVQVDNLEDEVDNITADAENHVAKLVDRYSAIETKLYQLQLMREQLQALWGNND
ncbi:flagellar filament capping protein FliD [Thalassospira sp. GB04J01]|mgnify:CR=1 FL=1|uniref:flagellar filament capping protein FliD n=1 Tax=Thalassospira sp. GB04J01 TaxID=1485225 RepID=UPI0011AF9268|nr:flagellar filament capping protein FliD [Thalassospira sp. GB04J01]